MVFLFDLGGVLSDIDVQGFLNRLQRLMPEGGRAGLDPDVLLAGGGDSFLHEYELGNITSAEALQHFHAFCRPEITDEQIRQVWLSELAPIQESRKVLLRHLRQQGHTVCLLSNTNDMHWQYIEQMFCYDGYSLKDHFDHVFLPSAYIYTNPRDRSSTRCAVLYRKDRRLFISTMPNVTARRVRPWDGGRSHRLTNVYSNC